MRRFAPLLVIGVALVVVAAWWFLYYSPKGDEVSEVDAQTEQLERDQQALEAQLDQLRELADRPESEKFADLLSELVPEDADLQGFIRSANDIAGLSGVDWVSVSPNPPAVGTGGGPNVINVSIQIQGRFRTVVDYLNRLTDLEEFRRLVVIDSVNISASEGATTGGGTTETTLSASGSPTLQVTLTGRMFTYQTPEGTPGAAPAPDGSGTPTTTPSGETTSPTTQPGSTRLTTPTNPNTTQAVS